MAWHVYCVVFRLHTPLHIGQGKIGYLQHTRPYVTGRVLRGALVNRVGRQMALPSDDPRDPFRAVSKTFAQFLTSTYFYLALKKGDDWEVHFPWEDEARFRRRFLGSYAGTALQYPSHTAEAGQLREIEYLAPHTLDEGRPVYLLGYLFVEEDRLKSEKYPWKTALHRLQLGGERNYGWGLVTAVSLERIDNQPTGKIDLFGKSVSFDGRLLPGQKTRPTLTFPKGSRTWAHVRAQGAAALTGPLEPLVGREWQADKGRHIGKHLAYNGLCYLPGSTLTTQAAFSIGEGGIWEEKRR